MALMKRVAVFGFGSFVGASVLAGLGGATASAEVEESAPSPYVTSRQALLIDENSLRVTDVGQARGFLDTRSGDIGMVSAQGAGVVVDSVKAVVGTYASPFNLGRPGSNNGEQRKPAGQFLFAPPIGSFGGANGG